MLLGVFGYEPFDDIVGCLSLPRVKDLDATRFGGFGRLFALAIEDDHHPDAGDAGRSTLATKK